MNRYKKLKPTGNTKTPVTIGASEILGLEDIDAQDIRIARIKLLQGSSQEVKSPDEYPNLRVGMLIDSITKEQLQTVEVNGKKVYPFVPVKMFKSWMKFNPLSKEDPSFDQNHEPGALIFKTYDANDPITRHVDAWKWKQINFLGFQPGSQQPMFINFASMSRPVGQDLINFISTAQRPVFEHLLHISSRTAEKNGNTFMVYVAKSVGKPEEDVIKVGLKMYQEFSPILADMKRSNVDLDDNDIVEANERPY